MNSKEAEKKMTRQLYVELYNLIDDQIREAGAARESAVDILADEKMSLNDAAIQSAIERVRKQTKRMNEMQALMKKFEEEVEEPLK